MPTMQGVSAGPIGDKATLDPLLAVAFLEQEASTLREALARPDCGTTVLRVMRQQECAHDGWLVLVGKARRAGHTALAAAITDLYGFHGRVAGTLEHGFHPALGPAVEQRLRLLLIAQLHRLTRRAIDRLVTDSAAYLPLPRRTPTGVPCVSRRRVGSPRR